MWKSDSPPSIHVTARINTFPAWQSQNHLLASMSESESSCTVLVRVRISSYHTCWSQYILYHRYVGTCQSQNHLWTPHVRVRTTLDHHMSESQPPLTTTCQSQNHLWPPYVRVRTTFGHHMSESESPLSPTCQSQNHLWPPHVRIKEFSAIIHL